MAISSITRYPGGVTNVSVSAGLADLKMPSPLLYNYIHSDFNSFSATDWTVAGTSPGAASILAAGDGGILTLPTTVTNPSETSMQFVNQTFNPDITKDLFIAARVRLDDASLGGFLFGLATTAASPLGTAPANGLYFRKLTGTPTGQAVARVANVDVYTATLPDVQSNVWYDLAIAYTAADGALRFFVGNAAIRLVTSPPDLGAPAMSLTFSVRNSSAAIRTLSIDNYFVAKAR